MGKHYRSTMSPIWQTVIGGIAAIIGGLVAAWWQTSRADTIAQNIRRAERREDGLLALNVKVTAVHTTLDGVYRAAEKGQATSQYLYALMVLSELRQLWEGSLSGKIPDQSIVDAYTALDIAEHERLPEGSLGAARQRELSIADKEAGQRFVTDLGHVLGLMEELRKTVQRQVEGLLRP